MAVGRVSLAILAFSIAAAIAQNPTPLRFSGLKPYPNTSAIGVALPNGAVVVLAAEGAGDDLRLVSRVVDTQGPLGTRNPLPLAMVPSAALRDRDGSIIVVGGLTYVNPSRLSFRPAVIARLDSTGANVLASRGLPDKFIQPGFTTAAAVTTDADGTIYVAGKTSSPEFPVTADAFQTSGQRRDGFGELPFAFYMKLAPDLSVLYSTVLGGTSVRCSGMSHCVGVYATTYATSVSVAADKTVTIGGTSSALDFPATPGTVGTTCECWERSGMSFVARFTAGNKLAWTTLLGPPAFGRSFFAGGGSWVIGVTANSDRSTLVRVQVPEDTADGTIAPPRLTVYKLGPDATGASITGSLINGYAKSMVHSSPTDAWAIISDVFGLSPMSPATLMHLDTETGRVIGTAAVPQDLFPPTVIVDDAGRPVVIEASGVVLTFPADLRPSPGIAAVVNAFEQHIATRIAPGEIISLYGSGLSAAGEVTLDEFPGTVLYASSDQINVQVPFGIAGRPTVELRAGGPSVFVPVADAQPAIANVSHRALALNEDGSINSDANPAAIGSIVTVWAHGTGRLPFTVLSSTPIQVVFAGQAPGMLEGIVQINFRFLTHTGGGIQVQAGNEVSEEVRVITVPPSP